MTALGLAWRSTQRYRVRAMLGVAGVATIGALLFDMLLLSRGLLTSFAELLRSSGYDVRVMSRESVPVARIPIADSTRLAADLRTLPEVADVVLIRVERGVAQTTDGVRHGVMLVGTTHAGPGPWTLVSGEELPESREPGSPCPLLVSQPLAATSRLSPGSAVQMRAETGAGSVLPLLACRVAGVVNFSFAARDEDALATPMTALREAMGETKQPEADLVLVAAKPEAGSVAAVRAIEQLHPGVRAYSNEDVIAQFNQNGFAYFRQISAVLSSMTMTFAVLLVATLLTVSVNQRLGEIAGLRALGIGRMRVASMLVWESVLLVGGGGVLALPLGAVLAAFLDRILRQMPGLPERLHFFVFEWRTVAIHLTLFAAAAAIAAAYPVWLTARLPIAATLRREVVD
jgi:putative ABC transport system permease protein